MKKWRKFLWVTGITGANLKCALAWGALIEAETPRSQKENGKIG